MDKYIIFTPQPKGLFVERLAELYMRIGDYLDIEQLAGRTLHYSKTFVSDIANQQQAYFESNLYNDLLKLAAHTLVGQAPANGCKIAVLLKTSDKEVDFTFESMRLDKGFKASNSTNFFFQRYKQEAEKLGMNMNTHLLRTWIYIADIDNEYGEVMKVRNAIFAVNNLTTNTHFIASTGIGGETGLASSVGMDFLSYPAATPADIKFLTAPSHLNPTHEYGVSFERGTRLAHQGRYTYFISGTASIDNKGAVLYPGNVAQQTARLLENISALLHDGEAVMNDIGYFIAYVRDFSDATVVETILSAAYPHIPHIVVHAKVCRPAWLVEMECVAVKDI